MKSKSRMGSLAAILLIAVPSIAGAGALTSQEELGKSIFFDPKLSIKGNQSCAACHGPDAGWTGPDSAINAAGAVYEGSILGRFGDRKPPSSAYATQSPVFHYVLEKANNKNKAEALFIGGNFWDGRATGEKLGNPAADQAQGPFLNPLEQALADSACVVYRACQAGYPVPLESVYPLSCRITWPADVETICSEGKTVGLSADQRARSNETYDQIALAIAAYEGSAEVNAFSSKYDCHLRGKVALTKQEKQGLNLFKSKGKCANCHVLEAGPNGEPPLLTDFTFDNLGVPRNPENPFYTSPFNPIGMTWVDNGLGGFLDTRGDYKPFADANVGKQKVPTLRNVDKRRSPSFVKAYAHNGYFKSLKGIVHFYNTRDAKPRCSNPFTTEAEARTQGCWPAPEVSANVNTTELGNLHLTDAQEDAIVAFMQTLSDGFACPGD